MRPLDIIAALEQHGANPRGDATKGWTCQCPAHDDRFASLSVSLGDDDRTLLNCFAGCEADQIVSALGLTVADLFDGSPDERRATSLVAHRRPAVPLPADDQLSAWADALQGSQKLLARLSDVKGWTADALRELGVGWNGERLTIPIRDGSGALVNVSRYLPRAEKKMLAFAGHSRDLFPAPETIADADPVWIVEGEPDAISMRSVGLPAVAVPGVQNWRPGCPARFAGRRVIVCCDCDTPGRKLAAQLQGELTGVASEVRVVDLARSRSDGYDAGDFIREASSTGELSSAREALEAMAEAAETVNSAVAQLAVAKLPDTGSFATGQPSENIDDSAGPGPSSESPFGARAREVTLTAASTIRTERIHWLWDGRIPRRSVVVFAGEKGLGKSTLTNAYLVARLTRGELDGEFHGQPMDVAIATAEDDWRSVVVPRLIAHGADLDRVHQVNVQDADGTSLLTLPDDVAALEYAVMQLNERTGRSIGLFVLDPISAFLSGTIDSHKDASVRRAIAPLATLADRQDLAVLVVAHLTKDEHARVLNRVTGSGAFVNAARAVLAWARDPDDPDEERGYRRVLVAVATNWGKLAPTLAAHIEPAEVETDEGPTTQPRLVLDGESEISASDLQRGGDAVGSSGSDALALALTAEWSSALDIKTEVAAKLGVTHRTVENYASQLEADGVLERDKRGFPAVAVWRLAPMVNSASPSLAASRRSVPPDGEVGNEDERQPTPDETFEAWERRFEASFGSEAVA